MLYEVITRLSLFRVISGTLGKEGNILNVTKDTKERFSQLLEIAGKDVITSYSIHYTKLYDCQGRRVLRGFMGI